MSAHDIPQAWAALRQDRRTFLAQTGGVILCGLSSQQSAAKSDTPAPAQPARSFEKGAPEEARSLRLFLSGDVMTGRGIDQVMHHPGDPLLHEDYAKSAQVYVEIAEQSSGPVPRRVGPEYVWGDALAELDRTKPDARIVNLETAVTVSADAWPGKGIHYRMHPANVAFLSAAAIDCCVLANNHVLDWGYDGLRETRTSLRAIGVRTAGAGDDEEEASAPAVIELSGGRRVLVFACGSPSSGVPRRWAALRRRPGIALFDESDPASVVGVARHVAAARRSGDVVVVALHWGGNWGYEVPEVQQQAARRLVDEAGVDVVYGHSSHHPRPVEVYRDRLILYGCGDFLNDYEGIRGYERFRPELGFMYLPELDPASGRLRRFVLVPTRIRRFRVNRATEEETGWLVDTMNREGRAFGSEFVIAAGGTIELRRDADASGRRAD